MHHQNFIIKLIFLFGLDDGAGGDEAPGHNAQAAAGQGGPLAGGQAVPAPPAEGAQVGQGGQGQFTVSWSSNNLIFFFKAVNFFFHLQHQFLFLNWLKL